MITHILATIAAQGTPQVASSTQKFAAWVHVQADPTNAEGSLIYVGGPVEGVSPDGQSISTAGIALYPGDSHTFPVMGGNAYSLNQIWLDGSATGLKARITYKPL